MPRLLLAALSIAAFCGMIRLADAQEIESASFNALSGDGLAGCCSNYSTWDQAHYALGGPSAYGNYDFLLVRSENDSAGDNVIYKAMMVFDTNALPDNAKIISADLNVFVNKVHNDDKDENSFVRLTHNYQSAIDSLTADDYLKCGAVDNPVPLADDVNYSNIIEGQYNAIPLNPDGLATINKEGYTQLGLRDGHDVMNDPIYYNRYVNYTNGIDIASSEFPDRGPYLEISYTLPGDGLVAYYPFSNNTEDESGNGNNGEAYGVSYGEGVKGICAYFEGESIQSRIKIPHTILNNAEDFTVSAFIKPKLDYTPRLGGPTIYGMLLSGANPGNYGNEVIIGVQRDVFRTTIKNETTADINAERLSPDNWYHLLVTRNGANGLVEKYLNGELYSADYLAAGPVNIYPNGLWLGTEQDCVGGCWEDVDWFEGMVDEVKIYNRTLSADEIKALYHEIIPEEPQDTPFTFAHMTDIHLGSNWVPGHEWYEEIAYPRFADGLFELSKLDDQPDFLLVGGDIVEYARTPWFRDYQSLVDGFYQQSGIPVYTVPGNHDRYRTATGNAFCAYSGNGFCEDDLDKYLADLDLPGSDLDESAYLIPGDPVNFRFTHNGVEFIGLDSGGDYLRDYELADAKDGGPEGDGLSAAQIAALAALDETTPKVLMTHHPVMSGARDACRETNCVAAELENTSFVNNYPEFLDLAVAKNVELVLAGHTHNGRVFNGADAEVSEADADRPLYLQTPSATKDGFTGHGYRLVSADGDIIAPEAPRLTGVYEKTVVQLLDGGELLLKVHDPELEARYITPDDTAASFLPYYAAAGTKRIMLYEAPDNTLVTVDNGAETGGEYGLALRREETGLLPAGPGRRHGYAIGESTPALAFTFASFHFDPDKRLAKADFRDLESAGQTADLFEFDWTALIGSAGLNGLVHKAAGADKPYRRLPVSLTAALGSPAELRLIDGAGKVTGQVNGERVEDIPWSLYENEYESATAYFADGPQERPLIVEVAGVADVFDLAADEFSLAVTLDRDGADSLEFTAAGLPIQPGMVYRFRFDWDELARGGEGTMVEIDHEGDGVFELVFMAGLTLGAADYDNQVPLKLKEQAALALAGLSGYGELVKYGLDKAREYLDASLAPAYWLDGFHLDPAGSETVFLYERQAASELATVLAKIAKEKIDTGNTATLIGAFNALKSADRVLAEVYYRETAARTADMTPEQAGLLAEAAKKLEQAAADEKPEVAINHYAQAWTYCRDAVN